MHFPTLLLGALAAVAIAAPAPHGFVLHEKRTKLPRSWAKREAVSSRLMMPMRIGLKQRNLDQGPDMLMEVSQHDSPKYGQYYTAEEIADIFAPHEETTGTVRQWLEQAGIAGHRISQSVNKQWLQFDAEAREVEELLKTKYHVYEHTVTGKANVACDGYHLPSHIRHHVDYITPGIKLWAGSGKRPSGSETETPRKRSTEKRTFGVTQGRQGKKPVGPPVNLPLPMDIESLISAESAAALGVCDAAVTPACIRAMYNFTIGTRASPKNQLGIFEDLGDMYAQEDLNSFFVSLAPRIPQGTHPTFKGIDGATAPTTVALAGPESDLDFQIAYPIIYPQNPILFQTDDDVYEANYIFNGFLNNFLDAIDGSYCTYSAFGETGNDPTLDPTYPDPQPGGYKGALQCGVYRPTNVISISYGGQEADLPAYYQQRQCNEYMKLGMQGVSILISSGDSGVAARGADQGNPDGCLGPNGTIFNPGFPVTCPYVSAVGGTFLPPGASAAADAEVAVRRFPSGGGFSNIFARPAYQKAAVAKYFRTSDPGYPYYSSVNNDSFGANGGIYNRAGRAYPDFSAVGDNVVIFNAGRPRLIGGTSASCPCFAGILTRINEERIAVGKRTVGFVNPALYAHPEVLHDITVGNNSGCNTPGFFAAKGWDPVTGLGTPNYPAMLRLFMSLP